MSRIKPGDLVIFENKSWKGIYLGAEKSQYSKWNKAIFIFDINQPRLGYRLQFMSTTEFMNKVDWDEYARARA